MAKQTVGKSKRYVRADGQHRKYGSRWTAIRKLVIQRDGCECGYCGRSIFDTEGLVLEVDHILPFALGGGEYDLDNCVTACFECNRGWNDTRKPAHIEAAVRNVAMARNRATE